MISRVCWRNFELRFHIDFDIFLVQLELLSMTCSSACPGSPSTESGFSHVRSNPLLLQSASSSEFSPSTRNEALRSGEGVSGAECTATRTIGSYKSQAGREIILDSTSFGLGSHLQHTTAAVLRRSPPLPQPHSRSVATESAARHVWNASSVGLGGISAGTCYHDPEEIDYVAANSEFFGFLREWSGL